MTSVARSYFNPLFSGSFSGIQSFIKNRKLVNHKDVVEALYKLKPYTLHRPFRKRFKRRKFMVFFRLWQFQCDLIDLSKYKKENNGNKYVLSAIDVFSKVAAVAFIKNKTTTETTKAMKKIIKQMGKPKVVFTDGGGEFKSRVYTAYMNSIGVKLWHAYGDNKAAIVERWHRTILSRLSRYWTHVGNHKYLKVLPKLVQSYNSTVHTTIKMKPKDVNDKNEHIVFNNTFKKMLNTIKTNTAKFKVGDSVLVSYLRTNPFRKGYEQTFKDEPFTINKVYKSYPTTYDISDAKKEVIKGRFYEPELTHFKT